MASTNMKAKITLTGAQETLLATLIGRMQDATGPNPILNDKWAAKTVEKINYDFSRMGMDAGKTAGVAMRGRLLDLWTSEFLDAHPSATVLHIACGLDARCHRVQHGPNVRWVDVDMPDVADLRRQVITEPKGDYRLLGASAATPEVWLDSIPNDRPTIVVFEGLSMYLREDDLRGLLKALAERFAPSGGQLAFDCFGTVALWLQSWMKPVEVTGSELHFGVDDPGIFEAWCPELKLLDNVGPTELMSHKALPTGAVPWSTRTIMWALSLIPWLRDSGRTLRYMF